jgi:homoserine O-succinyltransferase
MIITGAPVELLEFEEIDYWDELRDLFEFAKRYVYSTIYLCWAAMAGLYYHHGVSKVALPQKLHRVFEHRVTRPGNPLVRGFDELFYVPHSRHAGIARPDVERAPALRVLAESDEAGLHLLSTDNGREIYVMGHMEYDRDTLYNEYRRDMAAGMAPPLPRHYFADDDPEKEVLFRWRSHGHLLYSNWLNYYVYQETPFDLGRLT